MQKIFSALLFVCINTICFAQSFEGKITYENSFKSKIPNVTDQQLTEMMGPVIVYFMRGGEYKTQSNGTIVQWQLYSTADNKLYTKMSNNEAAIWNDATVNSDSVISSEVHPRAIEILGYSCDELVLTCKSGVQKYYYNSKFPLDPNLFQKHAYGNWYEYVKLSKAMPLKMVIDSPQFTLVSTASSVEPSKMDAKLFVLPEGTKTMKSPY